MLLGWFAAFWVLHEGSAKLQKAGYHVSLQLRVSMSAAHVCTAVLLITWIAEMTSHRRISKLLEFLPGQLGKHPQKKLSNGRPSHSLWRCREELLTRLTAWFAVCRLEQD